MAMPQRAPESAIPSPSGPMPMRRLRKGELLFAEGENSRAMYYLQAGIIRLFKRKGDSVIELDTIHSGQVLGELAFLDGNPRSASGEALTDCELIEISGPAFTQVLMDMPEWLKILLKTVVGRLRTASTRIRQLETASTAVDYSDKSGKRAASYIYLSPSDVLKCLSAILLTTSRAGSRSDAGSVGDLSISVYHRYGNQIMGVPIAKLTTVLDFLAQLGLISPTGEPGKLRLKGMDFVEELISHLNEQNFSEPSRRQDLAPRGFVLMSTILKYLPQFPLHPETGRTVVNLARIQELEATAGKEPFKLDDVTQLVLLGYVSTLQIRNGNEVETTIDPAAFSRAFRIQRALIGIRAINEQKRAQSSMAK